MIKELQKRPFVRPLFIWITGIVLQTCFSLQAYSFALLLIPLILLLSSCFISGKRKPEVRYENRWVWGMMFLSFLLFFSIQMTAFHANKTCDPSPNKLQVSAKQLQQQLLLPVNDLSLTDTEKSVLSTITLGYKQGMPREVRQQFSITGVAHILAVSGFHVAIVCSFLSFLLSFLPSGRLGRWVRYILILLLLWTFTLLSGLAASAVRSAIMLTLYLTGRQLNRKTDGYNTLAASAFCMLVYDPFYLFDIGFQLSYIAVYFILYIQPRLSNLIEVKNPLLATPWNWITVSIAAQTGVTFLCLYYFGQFSTVFLFTNLPVTFLSTLLIPATLLWILLPHWLPGIALLQKGIELLTHAMMWIVESFSHLPVSSIHFHFGLPSLIISYTLLLLLLYKLYKQRL